MTIKYIFCINPGRVGSDYLTTLLENAENTISKHEAFPILNGLPMQEWNRGNEASMRDLFQLKKETIERERENKTYCETSHLFINGWGDLVAEQFDHREVGIIILKRDVSKAAHSRLRIHDIPGLTEWTRTWLLNPNDKKNILPCPYDTPYELCKWHVDEVYARAKRFQKEHPDFHYFHCDISELNSLHHVQKLMKYFGLVPNSSLPTVVGRASNKRDEWPEYSLEELVTPSVYENADMLSESVKEKLVIDIVEWLLQHRGDKFARIKPDSTLGGSYFPDVIRIFASSEREIEQAFSVALFFTVVEWTIIIELVKRLRPRDLMFLISQPTGMFLDPVSFDFNKKITAYHVLRWFGFRYARELCYLLVGLLRTDGDITHRRE